MYIYRPERYNGVMVAFDQRTKFDYDVDHSAPLGAPPSVGNMAQMAGLMGHRDWDGCGRIALFDYGQKPSTQERHQARTEYREFIAQTKPKVLIVLPTISRAMDKTALLVGTQVWKDLTPPDSLEDMRGTFWDRNGTLVLPVFAPTRSVGEVNWALNGCWLHSAVRVAKNQSRVLRCADKHIHVGQDMLNALKRIAGSKNPIGIDIETIPDSETITAVGVANLTTSVSVPMDAFEPACGSGAEPGLMDYPMGRQILDALRQVLGTHNPKFLHNMGYDLPKLRERGLEINGPVYDTLAMHATAYPEARHGLQLAVATQYLVPPWKSLFHPKGLKRSDPKFWYWEAEGLRDYNADDVFYTVTAGESLAPLVGIQL